MYNLDQNLTISSNDLSNAKAIAISSGDLSIAIRNEVIKIMESNKNNVYQSVKEGLKELLKRECISAEELDELQNICDTIFNTLRGKLESEDAFFSIRNIYSNLLINKNSSPTALAIASVSSSIFTYEKSNSVNIRILPGDAAAGALTGGIIGATFGAATGGFIGAGIGAAIGAAAGAAIGWCNENGV